MQFPQNETEDASGASAVQATSAGRFVTLETFDPSEFEIALRPWELLAKPMSTTPFLHRVALLQGDGFSLYRETFSSAMSVAGLVPSGMLAIGVPALRWDDVHYWKHTHDRSSLPLSTSGPLDVKWDKAHEQTVALIDVGKLETFLPERSLKHLLSQAKTYRIDLPPGLRQEFARALNASLYQVERTPNLSRTLRFLEDVYDQIVRFLTAIAEASLAAKPKPHLAARTLALHRAIEFLSDGTLERPTLVEICQASGASERTLQYAFQDVFDMSPREFMIRRRLHAVRRELFLADAASTTVAELAMGHGFYELGRFAGVYRDHFGELPSTTLALRT